MAELIIMVGPPQSGKTTEAISSGHKIVSEEDIRNSLSSSYDRETEKQVHDIVIDTAIHFLSIGEDVVIDGNNLERYYRRDILIKIKSALRKQGIRVKYIANVMCTPLETCEKRNSYATYTIKS